MPTPCLRVVGLSVDYPGSAGKVYHAVQNVSFTVHHGEIFGIAGESGCGKSSLAHAIVRLLKPSATVASGHVYLDDLDLMTLNEAMMRSVRWEKVAIVPQSAMNNLSPVLRIGAQIVDAIVAHESTSRNRALDRARELLRRVGLAPELVASYPHQLSGGMRQRAVIAMALALNPQLLVMDEPTTALDVVVQAGIMHQIKQVQREFGFSVLVITHDLPLLMQVADRVGIMYAGSFVEIVPSPVMLEHPRHPYSRALMQAFPPLLGPSRRAPSIEGTPPDLSIALKGCSFAARCPEAVAMCGVKAPVAMSPGQDQLVVCHRWEEPSRV